MISKTFLKKLAKKNKKKLSEKGYKKIKENILIYLEKVIKEASISSDFNSRKIIKPEDIEF